MSSSSRRPVLRALLLALAGAAGGCRLPPAAPVAIVQAPADAPTGWRFFRDGGSGLSAVMPGTPRRVEDTVDTPRGPRPVVRFVVEEYGARWEIGYLQRAGGPLERLAGDRRVLEAAVDGTARDLGGVALVPTAVRVQGHPARQFDVSADGAPAVRLVITPERICHAIARGDGRDPAETRAFLESLRVSSAGAGNDPDARRRPVGSTASAR